MIDIEEYKGQLITYNEDNDKFECDISIEDKSKSTKRQSLKDVRKEVDNFVKLNLNFVPFKVIKKDWGNDLVVRDVSGIRTDGKFVVSDSYGSNYKSLLEMQSYNVYDPVIMKELTILQEELQIARNKFDKAKNELVERLKPLDLSKYQHVINTEE